MFQRAFLKLTAIVWLACLMVAPSFAVAVVPSVTIDFSGSVFPASQDISSVYLAYYGTDGDPSHIIAAVQDLGLSCAAANTCLVSTSIPLWSTAWIPNQSYYSLFGLYGGGSGVFVTLRDGLNGAAEFQAMFGTNEIAFANEIANGFTSPDGAFLDASAFVNANYSKFPSLSLDGTASTGVIWDYSVGAGNGGAELHAVVTPEPGSLGALVLGGLALIGLGRMGGRRTRARNGAAKRVTIPT